MCMYTRKRTEERHCLKKSRLKVFQNKKQIERERDKREKDLKESQAISKKNNPNAETLQ